MQRWPPRYPTWRKLTGPASVPPSQQEPIDVTQEVSAIRTPHEGSQSTRRMVEAGATQRAGEGNQAGVELPAGATAHFCGHCGAALEPGSAFCGNCGRQKIHPDRLKILLSQLIDEALPAKFCTKCGARVTEGAPSCEQCGQPFEKLSSETVLKSRLTSPEVEKAGAQLRSDGYEELRRPAASTRRSTTGLTQVDMLSIQHAIDLYEKKFPHRPPPSAEVALAWLASRRGHLGLRRRVASPVQRLMTLLRHDRSMAQASKPQTRGKDAPRRGWRRTITLGGGAFVVVVGAAVITSRHNNNYEGSSVPRVKGEARQRASGTTATVAEQKPSPVVTGGRSSGRLAVNRSPSPYRDTSTIKSSSTKVGHYQAGVPDVVVGQSVKYAEIQNTLDHWAQAMNNNDVPLQMRYYSDRLDRYFLARNVTQKFVVQDKARFYRKGNHIVAFHIANVTVDKQSAEQAAVSLTKHWEVSTATGTKSGETRSRLWLTRRRNQWIITGEQDLTKPAA